MSDELWTQARVEEALMREYHERRPDQVHIPSRPEDVVCTLKLAAEVMVKIAAHAPSGISGYARTCIDHARRQGAADGFQDGWHAALTRVQSGDRIRDLKELVPDSAVNAADRELGRRIREAIGTDSYDNGVARVRLLLAATSERAKLF